MDQAELEIKLSSGKTIGGMLFADAFVGISDSKDTVQKLINIRSYCSCLVCVCLYVCLSAHTVLTVHAIRSTCITKDAIVLSVRFSAILKWRFP